MSTFTKGALVVALETRHDQAFIKGHTYKVYAFGDTWLDVEVDSNGHIHTGWGIIQFKVVVAKKSIMAKVVDLLRR